MTKSVKSRTLFAAHVLIVDDQPVGGAEIHDADAVLGGVDEEMQMAGCRVGGQGEGGLDIPAKQEDGSAVKAEGLPLERACQTVKRNVAHRANSLSGKHPRGNRSCRSRK